MDHIALSSSAGQTTQEVDFAAMPERRIDADGGLYTYEEISSYYGKLGQIAGLLLWVFCAPQWTPQLPKTTCAFLRRYYSLKAIRSYWKRMHKLQPEVKQTKGNNKARRISFCSCSFIPLWPTSIVVEVLRWQRKQIVPKAALETSMNRFKSEVLKVFG